MQGIVYIWFTLIHRCILSEVPFPTKKKTGFLLGITVLGWHWSIIYLSWFHEFVQIFALLLNLLWDILCTCAQSWQILCSLMGCSPPGSSLHGIFPAGILEWLAISYSRGPTPPRDQTHVSCISCTGRQILYHITWKSKSSLTFWKKKGQLFEMLSHPSSLAQTLPPLRTLPSIPVWLDYPHPSHLSVNVTSSESSQ